MYWFFIIEFKNGKYFFRILGIDWNKRKKWKLLVDFKLIFIFIVYEIKKRNFWIIGMLGI